MYPINNFLLRQYDTPQRYGRSRYQYGSGARGLSMFRLPAAAAFPAVAPFYWVRLTDNAGHSQVFEFRPDAGYAPPTVVTPVQAPSVPGRKVVAIQGATNAQVAEQFATAINQVSALASQFFAPPSNANGRLGIFASVNAAQSVLNEVIVTLANPGPSGFVEIAGPPAPPAGFFGFQTRFLAGAGNGLGGALSASGFIQCVNGGSLIDTETFTIQGSAGGPTVDPLPITFEFNSGGGITPGNVEVPFTGGDTALVVAASVVAAINNPGAPPVGPNTSPGFWRVRAMLADQAVFPGLVLLRYQFPGSLGGGMTQAPPQFMSDTVAAAGFAVAGMMGGQDGSLLAPLRWGLSRGMVPVGDFATPPDVG